VILILKDCCFVIVSSPCSADESWLRVQYADHIPKPGLLSAHIVEPHLFEASNAQPLCNCSALAFQAATSSTSSTSSLFGTLEMVVKGIGHSLLLCSFPGQNWAHRLPGIRGVAGRHTRNFRMANVTGSCMYVGDQKPSLCFT
jgi:hypothetical protein